MCHHKYKNVTANADYREEGERYGREKGKDERGARDEMKKDTQVYFEETIFLVP
jgi:hypothetical protein